MTELYNLESSSESYKITSIKQISETLFLCTFNSLHNFYIRTNYLENQNINLDVGEVFSKEDFEDCTNAGLAFAAEKKAMEYLGKNEHSRFLLKNKLVKKEHSNFAIEKALDFLESKKYLDDSRYAMAFLRNRSITHYEGRNRLMTELLQRGVDKKIASLQIDEFFEEKDEIEIAKKALEKLKRIGKKEDKIIACLERLGFSNRVIRDIV